MESLLRSDRCTADLIHEHNLSTGTPQDIRDGKGDKEVKTGRAKSNEFYLARADGGTHDGEGYWSCDSECG